MAWMRNPNGEAVNVVVLILVGLVFMVPWLILGFLPVGAAFLLFGAQYAYFAANVWLGFCGGLYVFSVTRGIIRGRRYELRRRKRLQGLS